MGLALLVASSFALVVAMIFDRVETLGAPPRKRPPVMLAAQLLRDGLLIGLVALTIAAEPDWLRIALPVALVAVLRVGAVTAQPSRRTLYSDRIVQIALLLVAAALGWVTEAVVGLSLLALVEMLWTARSSQVEITTN